METERKMSEKEVEYFLSHIVREEMLEDIYDAVNKRGFYGEGIGHKYPRYLKAVKVSVVTFGFDCQWVYGEFDERLSEKYYNSKVQSLRGLNYDTFCAEYRRITM